MKYCDLQKAGLITGRERGQIRKWRFCLVIALRGLKIGGFSDIFLWEHST